MKREFLSELGLEDETIDKIMSEHGKTVNPLKEERDNLSTKAESLDGQIKDRDEQIEELEKNAVGNDELKSQIESMKQANEDAKNQYQEEIRQQKFDHALDKQLMQEKARNLVAVKSLLDLDTIKLGDDGELIGLSEQLEAKKESDWFLFEGTEDQTESGGSNEGGSNPDHVPGSTKKSNTPKPKDPYEEGRLKAQERFKQKEEE